MFDSDAQKPNVSYILCELSGDTDLEELKNHQNSFMLYVRIKVFIQHSLVLATRRLSVV